MLDREGYRPNVGIVLLNQRNEVFWGKRVGQHSWQFPQGGMGHAVQRQVRRHFAPVKVHSLTAVARLHDQSGPSGHVDDLPGFQKMVAIASGPVAHGFFPSDPCRALHHQQLAVLTGQQAHGAPGGQAPSACPADSFQFLTVLQRSAQCGIRHRHLQGDHHADKSVGACMMQAKAFTVQ